VGGIEVHVGLPEADQRGGEVSRISGALRHLHRLLACFQGILKASEGPRRGRGIRISDGRLGEALLALQVGTHTLVGRQGRLSSGGIQRRALR
jgi:hypothetical protein